jgi:shikimate 5-dehydrogenase
MSQPASAEMKIGGRTRFIISTSGRLPSIQRYTRLLQGILNLDVAYIPINSGDPSSEAIDPERFAMALRGMPCIGGAISRDIKHSIIPFLDGIDDLARAVSSVNTVIVEPQTRALRGYNTDALGFKAAISKALERSGLTIRSAVCYGYGGVTSVVVAVLRTMGINEIYLVGRRMDEAARRAQELGVDPWRPGLEWSGLFVNASPVTDRPLEQAVHFLEALNGAVMVFDHELVGAHLKAYCEARGIVHVPGTDMYYPQVHSSLA